MAVEYGSLPFQEQIEFFRGKQRVLTEAWTDVYAAEHDVAFMVAGAAKADLLDDLCAAIDKVVSEGATLQSFRKEFDALVEKHGWSYKGGRNWRTRVIYDTNLRQSYNAGREAQMADPKLRARRPYGLYRHGGSAEPRPHHLELDGLVLPLDDPWWDTWSPQNGWGCQCKKFMVSEADVKRLGLKIADKAPVTETETLIVGKNGPSPREVTVPRGIDPGFEYRPGATRALDILAKTAKWRVDIAASFAQGLGAIGRRVVSKEYAMWADEVLASGQPAGRTATLWGMEPEELAYLREKGREPLRADVSLADRLVVGKKARRHEAVGDALTTEEWRRLPALGQEAVLYDNHTGNLLYVLSSLDDPRKIKVVVAPNYWDKRAKTTLNSSRSVFKVGALALTDERRYTVIRGEVKK